MEQVSRMKMRTISALFLAFTSLCAATTELVFQTSGCLSGYDGCAEIEFCQAGDSFGYRLVGGASCGMATAPVIRMQAGKKYMLTLRNTASEASNLHTHGLHISGDGNSDDITRVVEPGGCLSYTYDIGADHRGGTFWYHAHKHGETKRHVAGGAFGMVIIEDKAGDLPNDSALREFATNTDYELPLIAFALASNSVFGNGQSPTAFDVFADTWYRLRVVSVEDAGALMDLTVSGCVAHAVAYDGVWRSTVPGPAGSDFQLTGASRVDLAVKCASSGSVSFGGTVIAQLIVMSGGGSGVTSPYFQGSATWQPRPGLNAGHYLEDLSGTSGVPYNVKMSGGNINRRSWDPDQSLAVMQYEDVQEWTIQGSGKHPFHLHVYHMQIVTLGGCGHHEEGQYYDVISSSDGDCTVRFRMADIAGRVVLHCHNLQHEDNGAMTWIDVIGGPSPDTSNIDYCPGDTGGCTPDGSCSPLFECGSDEGIDNCGDPCTLNSIPECAAEDSCVDYQCQGSCTTTGSPCRNGSDCCSNRCSSGKPANRVCLS